MNNSAGLFDSEGKLIVITQEDINGLKETLSKELSIQNNTIIATQENLASDLSSIKSVININDRYQDAQAITLQVSKNNSAKTKLVLTSEKLIFLEGTEELAYLSNRRLYITNATIKNSLSIHNIKFIQTPTGTAIVLNE